MTTIDPAVQSAIDDLFTHAVERSGLRQVEPPARLRRRVRVAPVAALTRLQQACCAVELAQGATRR